MTGKHFFWTRVQVGGADECWPCLNKPKPTGYCSVSVDNHTRAAHRVAYELARGPIPAGLIVRHTCDNRRCCNPAHLLLGTHADNSADLVRRGRHPRKSGALHGEAHPNARLTREQVEEIKASPESQRKLGSRFGVSKTVIGNIRRGEAWS